MIVENHTETPEATVSDEFVALEGFTGNPAELVEATAEMLAAVQNTSMALARLEHAAFRLDLDEVLEEDAAADAAAGGAADAPKSSFRDKLKAKFGGTSAKIKSAYGSAKDKAGAAAGAAKDKVAGAAGAAKDAAGKAADAAKDKAGKIGSAAKLQAQGARDWFKRMLAILQKYFAQAWSHIKQLWITVLSKVQGRQAWFNKNKAAILEAAKSIPADTKVSASKPKSGGAKAVASAVTKFTDEMARAMVANLEFSTSGVGEVAEKVTGGKSASEFFAEQLGEPKGEIALDSALVGAAISMVEEAYQALDELARAKQIGSHLLAAAVDVAKKGEAESDAQRVGIFRRKLSAAHVAAGKVMSMYSGAVAAVRVSHSNALTICAAAAARGKAPAPAAAAPAAAAAESTEADAATKAAAEAASKAEADKAALEATAKAEADKLVAESSEPDVLSIFELV